ncbi:MAG: DUF1275 family protein [Proteobacteria bacterium]|nr:DUF1275 family protein [Pseudomonadota bacterium]
MIRYGRDARWLAAALAALAGYVDATGFMGSGGFFVSFMSGNSTRLGIGLARDMALAAGAFGLIAAFVAGVAASSLVKRAAPAGQREAAVLGTTAAALTAAALVATLTPPSAFALTAFAMGAVNLLFEQDGDVRVGLTYMTGTLVKIGCRVADALSGGPRWHWLPHLALWLALLAGGALGATAFAALDLAALWPAAFAAWGLTLLAIRRGSVVVTAVDD